MSTQTTNTELQNLRTRVISAGVSSLTPVHVASARGAIVRDVEGREYIDFAGGIGVMNVGHCHPKVVAAIKDQAEKFPHTCFMVIPDQPAITLADKLCRVTPGSFPKKAVFVNSGAEAVENAVKIARCHTKRPAIIVFENAYHGRTLLTMTMTSKVKPYKLGFGPFAPEVYRMPFGDVVGPEKLKDVFIKHVNPEAVACVVAEPVQGEGGFIAPPPGYFQELTGSAATTASSSSPTRSRAAWAVPARCSRSSTGGWNRTLSRWPRAWAPGCPSPPWSAARRSSDSAHAAGLGGTYGANPVACSAGIAVMEMIEETTSSPRGGAGEEAPTRLAASRKAASRSSVTIRGIGAMLALEARAGRRQEPAADEAKGSPPSAWTRPHHAWCVAPTATSSAYWRRS